MNKDHIIKKSAELASVRRSSHPARQPSHHLVPVSIARPFSQYTSIMDLSSLTGKGSSALSGATSAERKEAIKQQV